MFRRTTLRPTAKGSSRLRRRVVTRVMTAGLMAGLIVIAPAVVNWGAWMAQTPGLTPKPSTPAPSQASGGTSAQKSFPSKFLGLDLNSVNQIFGPNVPVGLTTEAVRLDGYKVFRIAAPMLEDNQAGDQATPIQQRVESIENRLNQIAESNPNLATLEVAVQIDPSSGLPVILVNNQYLMTVTTLDATLQAGELERVAADFAARIRQALIRYQTERQPSVLLRQGGLALGILLLVVAGSLAANYWQRRLQAQRLPEPPLSDREVLEATPAPVTDREDNLATAIAVQQQMRQRQQRNFNEIQQWLLQVSQYSLWSGGCFLILGLFPYTRWLQPAIVAALQVPLKLVGIGLGVYLLIRISFVLIDRFFAALGEREGPGAEGSQRLTLRISTFSRVFQSVVAVTLISIGGLTSLAVIGVNLVPLLAGAGVIGLAISFASQSLIKDAINGFLILLEDQYGVGDVIMVGDVAGFVEHMNLRITQLRNNEGRLITIPNSEIKIVQNLSKNWSRVDLEIRVAYQEDPDRALDVVRQVATALYQEREWRLKMPAPPEVLGIDGLAHEGILIRVWIKTLPLEQWSVSREFRRRLKLALDRHGIMIGMPQQAIFTQSNGKAKRDGHSSPYTLSDYPHSME